MKLFFAILLMMSISGCAGQNKLAQSALSKVAQYEWTTLTCSGLKTWNACRQEASAICPNGFYTADHLENITIQRREVSIACKS